jgi:hypothetical protein
VPFQDGLRLKEQQDLAQAFAPSRSHGFQPCGQGRQAQLFPARNPGRLGLLPFHNTQLLTQQQDFEVFTTIQLSEEGEQIQYEREERSHNKPAHRVLDRFE